jgi:hypothetical protein
VRQQENGRAAGDAQSDEIDPLLGINPFSAVQEAGCVICGKAILTELPLFASLFFE